MRNFANGSYRDLHPRTVYRSNGQPAPEKQARSFCGRGIREFAMNRKHNGLLSNGSDPLFESRIICDTCAVGGGGEVDFERNLEMLSFEIFE